MCVCVREKACVCVCVCQHDPQPTCPPDLKSSANLVFVNTVNLKPEEFPSAPFWPPFGERERERKKESVLMMQPPCWNLTYACKCTLQNETCTGFKEHTGPPEPVHVANHLHLPYTLSPGPVFHAWSLSARSRSGMRALTCQVVEAFQ